jgi:methylase of polypeptide subunit release factors
LKLAERAADLIDQPNLVGLIEALKERSYRFTCPTPATHARVLAREPDKKAKNLVDVLGWSLPFETGTIDPVIEAMLAATGAIEISEGSFRSRLRASTLREVWYLHSAFPTTDCDAVFFGPDSYRFERLIRGELHRRPCGAGARIVDIGTGSGVGGIVAARLTHAASLTLTDINPMALRLARSNAAAAGLAPSLREGSILAGYEGSIDLALANPPFIVDDEGRTYRDGGDLLGAALSLEMTQKVLPRLAKGGRFILYTGSAIVGGADSLADRLFQLATSNGCTMDYEEVDADVFGEELEREAYRDVERIAIVSAVFTCRD